MKPHIVVSRTAARLGVQAEDGRAKGNAAGRAAASLLSRRQSVSQASCQPTLPRPHACQVQLGHLTPDSRPACVFK